MAKITRNGKSYDSGDVQVFINGIPIEVTSIVYGNDQEHQLNFGLSNKATSWSRGKITPFCTIGIEMHNITPLELASGGSLLGVAPFEITSTFINEFNMLVVDRILGKFQNEGREVTGEMGLKRDYELFTLEVNLNVAA